MIERKDKLQNKAKVVKSLAKNPSQTQREVAKDTWLANWTIHNQMKDIEQTWAESKIMDRVLEMDDKIMDLANQITLQKIINEAPKNEDGSINVSALSLADVKLIWDYANNSTKRKAIFWNKDNLDSNRDITIQI